MKRIIKKAKNLFRVFYWFVIFPFFNGEIKKLGHLFASLAKHWFLKTPYAAIIETSNTCNFNCPTCPTPHKKIFERRPPQFMDFEVYKKIIDNIKDFVHVVYLYNSNEPLLHPQIAEMIKYAAKRHLHTMISTNCALLDEKMARALLDSGLGELRFALDGLDKKSFEGFRVGGNFEIVEANIERFCRLKKELGRRRPMLTLQFILNKLNQDQIGAIKKFVKEHGVDRLYVKPFILSEYAYNREQIKDLSEKYFIDKDVQNENIVYRREGFGLTPKRELKNCPDVNKIFTVLADGRASICCFDLLGDYIYGRMDEQNLKALWSSDHAKKLRQLAQRRQLALCQVCGNIE